jgi:hypothetical protein
MVNLWCKCIFIDLVQSIHQDKNGISHIYKIIYGTNITLNRRKNLTLTIICCCQVQDYIYWIISTENDHRHHHKFIKYEKRLRKEGKNMFLWLIQRERWIEVKYLPNGTNVGDQLDRCNELKEVLRVQTRAEFANI